MTKIEKAKEVLRDAGYFTDNLWHIDDVKSQFEVFDNEDAQDILNDALTNEWIMEQINITIADIAIEKGFKQINYEN